MAVDEETSVYGMGQGCPTHGDEHMKECTMCGAEFCKICHPKSSVCPDCSESDEDEDEDDIEETGDADEALEEDEEEEVEEEGERLSGYDEGLR